MSISSRFLVASCVATVVLGCNSREPMSGVVAPAKRPQFLGPIPETFVNTVDAATFEQSAAKVGGGFSTTLTSLAIAPKTGLSLATPPAGQTTDGLAELAGCPEVSTVMGGFFALAALTSPAIFDPQTLVGKSCDAGLAAAGLSFVAIARSLAAQATSLGGTTLTNDTCTQAAPAASLLPIAATGVQFERTQSGTSLTDTSWPTFTSTLEGGSDGNALALRAETEADGVATLAGGTTHALYQWAAVASLTDLKSNTTISQRSEQLSLAASAPNAADQAMIERQSSVTAHNGPTPSLDEQTVYGYYVNNMIKGEWNILVHAAQGTGGSLNVDLTVGDELGSAGVKQAQLVLKTQASGGCVIQARKG